MCLEGMKNLFNKFWIILSFWYILFYNKQRLCYIILTYTTTKTKASLSFKLYKF